MIEEKLRELGGIKTLISHNYYSRGRVLVRSGTSRNYDAVKAITDPQNLFRDLYTKTCRAAMGLAGLDSRADLIDAATTRVVVFVDPAPYGLAPIIERRTSLYVMWLRRAGGCSLEGRRCGFLLLGHVW